MVMKCQMSPDMQETVNNSVFRLFGATRIEVKDEYRWREGRVTVHFSERCPRAYTDTFDENAIFAVFVALLRSRVLPLSSYTRGGDIE